MTSGLILIAFGAALWGLVPVIRGVEWWWQSMLIAALVALAGALARAITPRRWVPPLATLVAALGGLTVMFAAPTALLGVIPSPATFEAFGSLGAAGTSDIASESIPAAATEGIRFLLAEGVAVLAVATDLLALTLRLPVVAGIPLLVVTAVPGFVRSEFVDPWLFAITAAVWLAMVAIRARPTSRRTAVTTGAIALVAALIVPLVLPPVSDPGGSDSSGTGALATGLNPIVTLGDDLRQGTPTLALVYRTDDDSAQYLRLTVLDDFTGESWEPTSMPDPADTVDAFGDVPGRDPGVTFDTVTTDVEVANVLSRWLPVPYATRSITGLTGDWAWEPTGLTVRSESSNARSQEYTTISEAATPSVEQLIASAGRPVEGMDRYLALPDELPEIVSETAREVTSAAATPYEKALALQSFFRAGDFVYSEEAPVDEGYDGSGAEVLGAFLEARSGYCVHFSSAMAAMARTLGIPARVVVGFTPGTVVVDGEGRVHRVTTENLHAWPELSFPGIGWVRFEPTPGRGSPPTFAPLAEDDPTTPDVDESVPPPPEPDPSDPNASTPTPTPTPSATPAVPDDDPTHAGGPASRGGFPWGPAVPVIAVLAIVLAPALWRVARRLRRGRAARAGSAIAAWAEVSDLADDFGYSSDPGLTPRQLAGQLASRVDDDAAAALARLRDAVEAEAFAHRPGAPAAEDLSQVVWGLRRGAGLGRSIVAFVAPRSLIRPWLPTTGAGEVDPGT